LRWCIPHMSISTLSPPKGPRTIGMIVAKMFNEIELTLDDKIHPELHTKTTKLFIDNSQ
jgi:hypothetical protein